MKYPNVNPHLTLEEGECVCTKCNGWGYVSSNRKEGTGYKLCPKCLGRCMLDWIDAAIGKNQDPRWA